jgi:hypothetical protein
MSTTCTLSGTSILVSKTSCYGLQRVPVVLQRNLPLVANTEDPTRFLPDAALTLEPLFPNQASRRQNFVSLTKDSVSSSVSQAATSPPESRNTRCCNHILESQVGRLVGHFHQQPHFLPTPIHNPHLISIMPFCYATMSGLSAAEKEEVMTAYASSRDSTAAQNHAWSLLGQKRRFYDLEADQHNVEEPVTISEAISPSTRLRKRARVSYVESTESDIECEADSGYNSDASVEWGSRAKQPKTKRARKGKPVKPFPFLSLPSELRNKIYSLALEDPDGMVMGEGWRAHRRVPKRCHHISHGAQNRYADWNNLYCADSSNRESVRDTPCTLLPSLLAVSKQIYAEAAAILYSQPLHFTCTTALHSFLAPLSNKTASLVLSITLHEYETYGRGVRKAMNVSALTLLPKCTNLTLLRIEGFNHYHYHGRSSLPRQSGEYEGKGIAQQMYRDAAFWFDVIGAEKALKVLDISGLQREWHGQRDKAYEDAVETLRFANVAFIDELTLLIKRTGRGLKKGRKSKTASDGE